jgi:exodeoxyribonuclease V gamma subunit
MAFAPTFSFFFPQRFVADLVDKALPKRAAAAFYTRENLTWRIMKLLPTLVRQNEFAELRRYLAQARPELRRFQLAGKIAAAFDRYLAFRPQVILNWEKGRSKIGRLCFGARWSRMRRVSIRRRWPKKSKRFAPRGSAAARARLLFGISTLPPFYLGFLEELAQRTELHLFTMRPTPEWWGDIRSKREEARVRRQSPASAQLDLQLFERGNPLLASLGKLGREFLEKVTELNPTREHEHFQLPNEKTALAQLQRDIFQLHDPPPARNARHDGRRSLAPIPFLPQPDARNGSAARPIARPFRKISRSEAARHRGDGARHQPLRAFRRSGLRHRSEGTRDSIQHLRSRRARRERSH